MTEKVTEKGLWIDMAEELGPSGYSHATAYAEALKQATTSIEKEFLTGDARDASNKAAQYSRVLPGYPDQCMIGSFGGGLFDIPTLNPEDIYPKETALLNICRTAVADGRRVGIFVLSFRYGLAGRLGMLLHCDGIDSYNLDVHAYIEGRTAKMNDRLDEGIQVVIAHPGDMWAGLATRTFDEIVYYEIDWTVKDGKYSVGGRLQEVTYLAYRDCMQQQVVEHLRDNKGFAEGVFSA